MKYEFEIRKYDFGMSAEARAAREEIKKMNYSPDVTRRMVIISNELERNLAGYSEGGSLGYKAYPDKIVITSKDTGPGIADAEQALAEGYSSADAYLRSMGYGTGMGLPLVKRLSDEFEISSAPGEGTVIRSVIYAGGGE